MSNCRRRANIALLRTKKNKKNRRALNKGAFEAYARVLARPERRPEDASAKAQGQGARANGQAYRCGGAPRCMDAWCHVEALLPVRTAAWSGEWKKERLSHLVCPEVPPLRSAARV